MDILRYITEELPRKRLQGLNKQLEYLKQPLASTASQARLLLANYYITNHKSEFFTLYQAGKEVDISQLSANPRALTLIKSKTSGNTQWVTVDSQSNRVPSIQNMTAQKALMYMSQNFAFEGLTSKKR